ncbi:hypothetical protein AWV79_33645 [Cupriavidus sp. UYMMa02A]|nr:hypothetical protein AWV79_33645 [Cupriavidus sp. UYMMa02A]
MAVVMYWPAWVRTLYGEEPHSGALFFEHLALDIAGVGHGAADNFGADVHFESLWSGPFTAKNINQSWLNINVRTIVKIEAKPQLSE